MIGFKVCPDHRGHEFMVKGGLRAVFYRQNVKYELLYVKKTLHLVKYSLC